MNLNLRYIYTTLHQPVLNKYDSSAEIFISFIDHKKTNTVPKELNLAPWLQ